MVPGAMHAFPGPARFLRSMARTEECRPPARVGVAGASVRGRAGV